MDSGDSLVLNLLAVAGLVMSVVVAILRERAGHREPLRVAVRFGGAGVLVALGGWLFFLWRAGPPAWQVKDLAAVGMILLQLSLAGYGIGSLIGLILSGITNSTSSES